MLVRNVTRSDLQAALDKVNTKFENNITFKRLDYVGKTLQRQDKWTVTLTTKDTKKAGHRLGLHFVASGRRRSFASACWHVYGTFVDALPHKEGVNVKTALNHDWRPGDEWVDTNIGSKYAPLLFSEACGCKGWE